MTTDVRATGLYSLRPVILGFVGIGMMMEHLKQAGTSHSSSDLLKICKNMESSWAAQVFRQECRRGERGVGGGDDGCVETWSEWLWGVRPGVSNLQ